MIEMGIECVEKDESMFNIQAELSKRVGWYPRPVFWPDSMKELEAASDEQLLEWYRFLPGAQTDEQRQMENRIIEKLFMVRRGG